MRLHVTVVRPLALEMPRVLATIECWSQGSERQDPEVEWQEARVWVQSKVTRKKHRCSRA